MGVSNYILIFIVVICVVALIYIARKRKALEEDSFIKPTSTFGASITASASSDVPSVDNNPSEASQETIYEYSAKTASHTCPFCDGENNAESKKCVICGRTLS